jgi:hypothetical protein
VKRFKFLFQKNKKTKENDPFFTDFDHSSNLKGNTFNALYDNHPDAVFTLELD